MSERTDLLDLFNSTFRPIEECVRELVEDAIRRINERFRKIRGV